MSPHRFSFTLPMATVKIPQPKQLRVEKVYFDLTFQMGRVYNGGNGMARGAGSHEVSISSVCSKQSSDRKWGGALNLQHPPPVAYSSRTMWSEDSKTSPKGPPIGVPNI